MKQYLELLKLILNSGSFKNDRTKTGVLSLFGYQMRFNMKDGFPLVTTKKVHFRSIVHELLWFLNGDTNVNSLKKVNVKIWNEWADENGDLGPIYGKQWRNIRNESNIKIDQISNAINLLKNDPDSRRILVCSWNVSELDKMALFPCHCLFQFYVSNKNLSLKVYQRSADMFLGVPFNIASYALLLHMIAQVVEMKPHELIYSFGDMHIYSNHFQQVKEQINRKPYNLSKIELNKKIKSIFDFKYEDIQLKNYISHSKIEGKVAI